MTPGAEWKGLQTKWLATAGPVELLI
jgi:hypothetical protein